MNVDDAKNGLAAFLVANQFSSVAPISAENNDASIKTPWGDPSIYIKIPDEPTRTKLFTALNNVLLPEHFTAVWHKDSKDFEVMYTAFPLIGTQKDVRDRKFIFSFHGKDYVCEFALSSDRLMFIAENAMFVGPSRTDHRNLPSFRYYLDAEKGINDAQKLPDSKPVSFWVRNVEWSDEAAVELARHLNYYMTNYDIYSPQIDIHAPKPEKDGPKPRDRYIAGSFPNAIIGTDLNSNLMHFWAASRSGDMFRRFLYCYQILEFASFYFVEEQVKRAVKKALATPHIRDEMDNLIIKIIDHVQESRIWEGNKMDALLKDVVDPKLIWREIEKNKPYFATGIEFDGGYVLKPLIVDKTTEETFQHEWQVKFNLTIRNIRNALSHGKEQSMSAVIAPTPQNFANIQPWGGLMSIAAGEVVTYYSSIV